MHRRARRNVRTNENAVRSHLECDNEQMRYFCGTIIITVEENSRCNALERWWCTVAFSVCEAASTHITDRRHLV